MTKRFFLQIAYNGSNYHGWQRQPNALTVQEAIEERLGHLLSSKTTTMGCGRTDTGVHASHFMLHFDHQQALPDNFLYRLDKALPPDIVAQKIYEVAPDAHARYDATRRSYDYFMHFNKDPFAAGRSTFVSFRDLDIELMRELVAVLPAYEDFQCFCKSGGAQNSTRCEIFEAELIHDPAAGHLRFHISANRFLRGMIRLIVGSLLLVGRRKIEVEDVEDALSLGTSLKRSLSAPAEGLYLTEVHYPYIERYLVSYLQAP